MRDRLTSSINGIRGAHLMRQGAMSLLTDADLEFSPGGDNVTLGELLKASGDIQQSYTRSLKTLKQDWSESDNTAGLTTQIASLKTWFKQIDDEMKQILQSLTGDDLQKTVDRGNGVIRTVDQQLEIYIQALMIFLGKLVVYFRAMRKELPASIQQYIA